MTNPLQATVARHTGPKPAPAEQLPAVPALVDGWVTHRRTGPVRHGFRNRVYQWLIDLDEIPTMPWYLRAFAQFSSADHLGDPRLAIKENVENYLALHGIDLGDRSKVLMLANARVLGHAFNPLSVYWCHDSTGELVCVIAEVHNTYGERHAYLLRPDAAGRARTSKEMYVSPFFDVAGSYELRFMLTPTRVTTTVTLRHEGTIDFSASFQGHPHPVTNRNLARRLLSNPLMPQQVSALIRMHGLWLWLRGLPISPRPHPIAPKGV